MPNRLSISNIPQPVTVMVNEITGTGDAESPQLQIPITIAFTPYRASDSHPYTQFDLLHLSAELSLTDKGFKASRITTPIHFPIRSPYTYPYTLCFPLTRDTLFYIEKYRNGNLPATILLTVQVVHFQNPPQSKSGTGSSIQLPCGFENAQAHLTFQIDQSRWVKDILPKLGYSTSMLIELPTASIILPEKYSVSIAELQEARRYFTLAEYDKTAGHCRSAIEHFKRNFAQIKPSITSDSEAEWMKTQIEATWTYVESLLGANYTVTNKTHHPPSIGHFGRSEAEIVLNSTILILTYIGKIGLQ